MKAERLDFLVDNPFYTKRIATYVGRRCRESDIKAVAKELHLDWRAVKEPEKQYMRALLARVGTPARRIIGIDEVSIRKGHDYGIVVSDLGYWLPDQGSNSSVVAPIKGIQRGPTSRLRVLIKWTS